jgi:hypothetical protein
MANEIEKVNAKAITGIETLNGKTDANIEKINGKEFTGLSAGTWSASSASLSTARTRFFSAQGSTRAAMAIIGGLNTSGLTGRLATEEEYDGSGDSISSGQSIGISGMMGGAGSATSAVVVGGTANASYVGGRNSYEFSGGSWSSITNVSKVVGQGHYCGGVSENDIMMLGGTANGDCDLDNTRSESWDGSSWTVETAFTGSVYGPNGGYGGGGGENDFRMVCGYYTQGTGSCSRASGQQNYSYDGSSWTADSNASSTGSSGWGGGATSSFAYAHFNSGGSATTYLFDGSSWSAGGANSNDRYAGDQNHQTNNVDAAAFGGGTGSGYSAASTTISLFDR